MNVSILRTAMRAASVTALLGTLGLSATAQATIVDYSLDTYTGTGSPGSGPFGTVELNDHGGSSVEVTVTLASGEGFVNTGAGAALTWTLKNDPSVTLSGLDTTKFSFSHSLISPGGAGDFDYAINCIVCGTGGSNPYTGSLNFTIQNIALADFVSNGKTANGYYFASDICSLVLQSRCAGVTGNVVATSLTDPPPTNVPEPTTPALFGAALIALAATQRRLAGGR